MKIYFDNSATTAVYDEVVEEMVHIMKEAYGNPSSINKMGTEAELFIKEARKKIAKSMKCKPEEILFTSGGTEANNIAIMGYLDANRKSGNHIITSAIEHPSVLNTIKHLEKNGYEVTYLNVDKSGQIDLNELENSLQKNTVLVSIMYVNNEIGSIQPIEEIAKRIKQYNKKIVFHVDCIQGFGKIDCNVKRLGCDLASISSHKFHGPKGVGGLFIKKGTKVNPLFFGGGQENSLRVGTENVPGIVGMGKAAELTAMNVADHYDYLNSLRLRLVEILEESGLRIKLNTDLDNSAPHILNVSFLGMKGEIVTHSFEGNELYVSTGSACSSKKRMHSHVLQAIDLDLEGLEGAIRFSFSKTNTLDEVENAGRIIVETVKDLNQIIKGRI